VTVLDLPYRAGAALHRRWSLARPRAALPRFTVSVGALHFGGAGKTPLTLDLALEGDGILLRGYGGSLGAGHVAVRADDDGDAPWQRVLRSRDREATARQWSAEIGDEAALAAALRPGVTVGVGRSRELSVREVLAMGDARRLLLDDGFSHHRLRRDVDLLVMPVTGSTRGARIARGPMREGIRAAQRAHAVVFLSDFQQEIPTDEIELLKNQIHFSGPVAVAHKGVDQVWSLQGQRVDMYGFARTCRAAVVCALGRPESLALTSSHDLGVQVVDRITRRDHHRFTLAELAAAERRAARSGADVLLTSLKDAVRLPPGFEPAADWFAVGCGLRWENGRDALSEMVTGP